MRQGKRRGVLLRQRIFAQSFVNVILGGFGIHVGWIIYVESMNCTHILICYDVVYSITLVLVGITLSPYERCYPVYRIREQVRMPRDPAAHWSLNRAWVPVSSRTNMNMNILTRIWSSRVNVFEWIIFLLRLDKRQLKIYELYFNQKFVSRTRAFIYYIGNWNLTILYKNDDE